MARMLWSGFLIAVVAVLMVLVTAYGVILTGKPLPVALGIGCLLSGVVCLAIGAWRHVSGWIATGLIEFGGVVVAMLMVRGVANWWWPLGLVALGIAYVPLATLPPGWLGASWRSALESSAPFVAGVGAVWELGQVIIVIIFTSQGAPLLADDATALNASFLLSSLLLIGGSLLWAVLWRRLLALALTGLLAVQLVVALVGSTTSIGNPSAGTLLALGLLVVALVCHIGTYPLRLLLPDLAPGNSPAVWRLLMQRRGRRRSALALKGIVNPETWWLCVLLDSAALLFTLAALPLGNLLSTGMPEDATMVIVLSAGVLLSIAVAYWQNTSWLLLLGGCFLAVDLFTLGGFSSNPPDSRPLLYLVTTMLLLGVALYLKQHIERFWVRAILLVAAGSGALALDFAFRRQSMAWEFGIAAALAAAALVTCWGWQRWPINQRPS